MNLLFLKQYRKFLEFIYQNISYGLFTNLTEGKLIFKKHKESVSKYEDIIQMQNILK